MKSVTRVCGGVTMASGLALHKCFVSKFIVSYPARCWWRNAQMLASI